MIDIKEGDLVEYIWKDEKDKSIVILVEKVERYYFIGTIVFSRGYHREPGYKSDWALKVLDESNSKWTLKILNRENENKEG
jgi:hypothetical protein